MYIHVFCHCEVLARTRFLVLGIEYTIDHRYIKESFSKTISHIRKAKYGHSICENVAVKDVVMTTPTLI